MKWVVLAVAAFIVGYTVVNLYFRKPGRANRPYEDMANRFTTAKLREAGWQKIPIDSRRPVEKPGPTLAATIQRGANGLGPDLDACFAEKPALLASIDRVTAPTDVTRGESYTAYFTASVPDLQYQLGNIELYRRGQEIVLVPSSEHLPGKNLLSRWDDANYSVSFSTQALPPGRYTVRLVARGPAAQWTVTVR
ncbi:MAG: hypothetical protein HYV95_00465 [Opitutae bacterium]|nr:hypothetical protein [Opitutae bacterium]